MITFICEGQHLSRSDQNIIVTGSSGFVTFSFSCDESWAGYCISAQFYRAGEKIAYHVANISPDTPYPVPAEVLTGVGQVFVTFFGVKGDSYRATTNPVCLDVGASGVLGGKLPMPSEDIFNQFVKCVLDTAEKCGADAAAAVEAAQKATEAEAFIRTVFVEEEFARTVAEWNAMFLSDVENARASVEVQKNAALTHIKQSGESAAEQIGTLAEDALTSIESKKEEALSALSADAQSKVSSLNTAYAPLIAAGNEAMGLRERVEALEKSGGSDYIAHFSVMPAPSADCLGATVLYTGEDATHFEPGGFYRCVDENGYAWRRLLIPARPQSWDEIAAAVRRGEGEAFFPVGYELTCRNEATGREMIWVVRGHDIHESADGNGHTMTLELKHVYSDETGTYLPIPFDGPEALYYAIFGLTAGQYYFTVPESYGGQTITFTLTQDVPAMGMLTFPWEANKDAAETKISSFASATDTVPIESVPVVSLEEWEVDFVEKGTFLGCAEGGFAINHIERARFGSNDYASSALRSWLNSDQTAGNIWTPFNDFDRPPHFPDGLDGFMRGIDPAFLAAVKTCVLPCVSPVLDGGALTNVFDKFFLLSRGEVFARWDDTSKKDGESIAYYKEISALQKAKYDESGTVRQTWLRSPYIYSEARIYTINPSGQARYLSADTPLGVTPACIIG